MIISVNVFIALLMFLRLPSVLTLFLLAILYCFDCILQLPRSNFATAEIAVKVILKNHMQLLSKRTAPDYHYVSLIIGNTDNSVIFLQKLMWEGNNFKFLPKNKMNNKIYWLPECTYLFVSQGLGALEAWKLVEENWGGKELKRTGDQYPPHQLGIW